MKKWSSLAVNLGIVLLIVISQSGLTRVFAQSAGYEIKGKVTNESGNPIPEVQISIGSVTVKTDSMGNYTIKGLTAGRYTVTASLTNYTFVSSTPMPIDVPRDGTVDFTGTPLFNSISGRVTDSFGRGVPNVDISVDGLNLSKTNFYGYYEIGGFTAGVHTVVPQLAQYTFEPASRKVTLPLNGVLVNFQANSALVYTLDGTIVRSNDTHTGVMGVKVSVGDLYQATTDGQGRFIIRGIPPGDYELKAELNGYQFNLPKPSTINFPPSQTLSLIATPYMNTIRGRIIEAGSGEPVPGVAFKVGCGMSAISNAAGYYSITGLPDGVFTIEPSLKNTSFTPSQATLTLPMDGYVDFVAEPLSTQGSSLSGYIKIVGENEEPLAGVEVDSGAGKGVTNINGYYKIPNLPNGVYIVKPALKGFTFTPSTQIVEIPHSEDVNFEAAPIEYTIRGKVANAADTPTQGAVVRAGVGLQAVTNAHGVYVIGGLPAKSTPYTLTAALDGSTFTPNQTMPVSVPPIINNLNFLSANATLYGQVDGYVTYTNGQPVTGALVKAKPNEAAAGIDRSFSCCCPDEGSEYIAYTDVNGYYALGGMPVGEYEITVVKSGHSFESLTPLPIFVPQSGVNFRANVLPNTYSLSGTITDISSMSALAGVKVYLKEGSDYSGMTNKNGYYVIGGIPTGNYSPQAVLFGYTFRALTQLPINFSGNTQPPLQANFEASSMLKAPASVFAIQGRIINALGEGIPFATIQINPNQLVTESTDINGYYSYHWLTSNQSYTLTPQKSGCIFTPSSRVYSFTSVGYPLEQNFTAECSYSLTFWIKDKAGSGINGVKVVAKPSPEDAQRSEVNAIEGSSVGEYIFNNLKEGVYIVQPSREGYSFIPSSFLIEIPKKLALPTFLGFANNTIYTVGGNVVNMQGEPLAGVTIMDDGGNSTVTDSKGNYLLSFSIESLTPGTNLIKLIPISADYIFTPTAREIDVSPLRGKVSLYPTKADIENQNFVGRKR